VLGSCRRAIEGMFELLDERVEEEITRGHVSDVCFGAGPRESSQLFSSRGALALASRVFHAMFFAPHWHTEAVTIPGRGGSPALPSAPRATGQVLSHQETADGYHPERHTYVAVTDVEPSALHCMLRYVHHLDPRLTLDNALHVYRAADKYQMDGLLGACAAFLEKHVDQRDVDQVLRLFDIACRLGLERYSNTFLDMLGEQSRLQTSRLLFADEFAALHSVSIATLLGADGLCVDEDPLWSALQRWAELQVGCGECRPELSPEVAEEPHEEKGLNSLANGSLEQTWQDVLKPLKRLIRFPAMSASFFAKQVAQSGVLSPSEVVDIFCHLSRSSEAATRVAGTAKDGGDLPEVLVADAFRAEPRAPQLAWCAAPGGAPDTFIAEECGLGPAGAAAGCAASTAVLDGHGLKTGPWGSQVILGGSGAGYHFAFGSAGFSSGRHAWTISWQPLDALQPGVRTRGGRGGAAGIAREGDLPGSGGGGAGTPSGMTASSPTGGCGGGLSGPATSLAAAGRTASTGSGTSGRPAAMATSASLGAGSEEPAARFIDWPTCIVFGVKRDVSERRYVGWEAPVDGDGGEASVRFAIALDFATRTVTYIADRGERCWTAPLAHDGPVYPVVAATGPHNFRIQYGVHL